MSEAGLPPAAGRRGRSPRPPLLRRARRLRARVLRRLPAGVRAIGCRFSASPSRSRSRRPGARSRGARLLRLALPAGRAARRPRFGGPDAVGVADRCSSPASPRAGPSGSSTTSRRGRTPPAPTAPCESLLASGRSRRSSPSAQARTLWAVVRGLALRAVNGEGLPESTAIRESLLSFGGARIRRDLLPDAAALGPRRPARRPSTPRSSAPPCPRPRRSSSASRSSRRKRIPSGG